MHELRQEDSTPQKSSIIVGHLNYFPFIVITDPGEGQVLNVTPPSKLMAGAFEMHFEMKQAYPKLPSQHLVFPPELPPNVFQ